MGKDGDVPPVSGKCGVPAPVAPLSHIFLDNEEILYLFCPLRFAKKVVAGPNLNTIRLRANVE